MVVVLQVIDFFDNSRTAFVDVFPGVRGIRNGSDDDVSFRFRRRRRLIEAVAWTGRGLAVSIRSHRRILAFFFGTCCSGVHRLILLVVPRVQARRC